MSKKECQVMRDLMPLCIDGAASEASRELVVKHVWECEECGTNFCEKCFTDRWGRKAWDTMLRDGLIG